MIPPAFDSAACEGDVWGHNRNMKFPVRCAVLPVVALLFCFAGCGDRSSVTANNSANPPPSLIPQTGPAITASPNPVLIKEGNNGTVTIAWNTGGGVGEVYVAGNGADERIFARGEKGSQEAPWIAPASTTEFRLYNADKSKVLGSVTVTGVRP